MHDVEATLARLEARLQALQAELLGAPVSSPLPSPPAAPPAPDPLEDFGRELRRTADHLVEAFDRALTRSRGGADGPVFAEDVAVEVQADFPNLCALHGALGRIPGVHAVELRAFAGGHAALELALERPVALVAELRRASPVPFAVVEARPGRLVVEVRPGAVP